MNNATSQGTAKTTLQPEEILTINLHKLLTTHHLTEAELARQTQIPQPTLHKILSGKTEDPRISTLQSIASFFGVTIDELYILHPTKKAKETVAVQSVPIISWKDCLKGKDFYEDLTPTTWNEWLVIEQTNRHLYALVTKPSMEPHFPKGSILVIDPDATPSDGDLVIVHYHQTDEATIREVSIDGPSKLLIPINSLCDKEPLHENIQLLGIVIQSRFSY